MATNSREARRRRILERGSDRLALITGRIQTGPSSTSSPESNHSDTTSCPPSIIHDHDLLAQNIGSQVNDDISSSSLLLQHESASESGAVNANDSEGTQPVLSQHEASTEALIAHPSEVNGPVDSLTSEALIPHSSEANGRVDSSRVFPGVLGSSISPSNTEHPQIHHSKFLTPNQISSALADSEVTRICCSIGMAILVVLSYVGFPILGSHFLKSIIFFRPLYLVLLTNVSIVLARILSYKQRGSERAVQGANSVPLAGGDGLTEQIAKALEWGLALRNMMVAVFMDCSFYSIVVICGLSMAQKLGSKYSSS